MHPYLDLPTPHLFGHRGASGELPENTIASFEGALASGVPYIEMDCHATRDGEIVVHHDAEVDRTTDGEGPIKERLYKELEQLDAGYRFSPDGGRSHPFRGRGIRIPRLADVLERFPAARINLEVKQSDPEIASKVVALIRRTRATERTLLAAEDEAVLESIRALEPGTALGSSLADVLAFFGALDEGRIDRLEPRGHALQIPAGFQGRPLVTRESVAAAHAAGLHLHVWTINDPDEMRLLLELGVHGLMSDFPSRLVRVERSREARP